MGYLSIFHFFYRSPLSSRSSSTKPLVTNILAPQYIIQNILISLIHLIHLAHLKIVIHSPKLHKTDLLHLNSFSMSASARTALEKLQHQVEAGALSISSACDRLEGLLPLWIQDELTRPFLSILPDLLTILFGDVRKVGWLGRAVDSMSQERLYHFLMANGKMHQTILYYAEMESRSTFFPLPPADFLPIPLLRALESASPSLLPSPLDNYIVKDSKDLSSPYNGRFDIAEYFIVRLLMAFIGHIQHGEQPSSAARSFSASASQASSFAVLPANTPNKTSTIDSFRIVYEKILRTYLDFFMPLAIPHHINPSQSLHEDTAFAST